MYVSQLDRPWLDTPFLFQGFFVRDEDEIAEVRQYCRFVYVADKGVIPPSDTCVRIPVTRALTKASNDNVAVQRSLTIFDTDSASSSGEFFEQTNVVYEETHTLGEEYRRANDVHQTAMLRVEDVMRRLRESQTLDVDMMATAVEPLVDSVLRNNAAMGCLMRLQQKNDYLFQHSLATSVWATVLGRQLGLPREDLNTLAMGAALMDVGMTRIPDSVLDQPRKLRDREFTVVRHHIQYGLEILDNTDGIHPHVRQMVAHHHERYNGTGYPEGLSGNQIPVFGRIAGIVDAYDAMISARPYSESLSSYDAIRQLRVLADVEFQAEIVDQFTQAIGAFPTGTLVELNTGEIAVVTRQNPVRRLRPEVLIIATADQQLLDDCRLVDLDQEKVALDTKVSLWIERGLAPGAYGIDPAEYYLL